MFGISWLAAPTCGAFARLAAVIGEASAGYNAASHVAAQRRTTLHLSLAILSRQSGNSCGRRPALDPDIINHGEAGLITRPRRMFSLPRCPPRCRIDGWEHGLSGGAYVHVGDHKAIGKPHALGIEVRPTDHRNGISAAAQRIAPRHIKRRR